MPQTESLGLGRSLDQQVDILASNSLEVNTASNICSIASYYFCVPFTQEFE
jgi:hypothetical protein